LLKTFFENIKTITSNPPLKLPFFNLDRWIFN